MTLKIINVRHNPVTIKWESLPRYWEIFLKEQQSCHLPGTCLWKSLSKCDHGLTDAFQSMALFPWSEQSHPFSQSPEWVNPSLVINNKPGTCSIKFLWHSIFFLIYMFLKENLKNLLVIFPHPLVVPNIGTHIINNELSTALFNLCHLKKAYEVVSTG